MCVQQVTVGLRSQLRGESRLIVLYLLGRNMPRLARHRVPELQVVLQLGLLQVLKQLW